MAVSEMVGVSSNLKHDLDFMLGASAGSGLIVLSHVISPFFIGDGCEPIV